MKLSEREARILAAVELEADTPMAELQKRTSDRPHVIRYALRQLEDRGVIRPLPFIDLSPLGYQDVGLYFSLAALRAEDKQPVLRMLQKLSSMTFLAELGGDYQYFAGFYIRHIREFGEILDRLGEQSPGIFFDKAVTLRLSLTRFNRKYLSPGGKIQVRSFGRHLPSVAVDALDERMLATLEAHGGESRRMLAERLGIPFSTFQYRLRQLTEKGIFQGMIHVVNPEKIGMLSFQLLIHTKGLPPGFQKELLQYAQTHLHVVYVVRCIGAWDFEVGIEVARAEDATRISQELYEKMGIGMLGIKIVPVFSFLKYGFFRPSDAR